MLKNPLGFVNSATLALFIAEQTSHPLRSKMKKRGIHIIFISALLGFLVSLVISEVVVRIVDIVSNQPSTGLDVLAEAAAYTTIRLVVIGVGIPIITLVLYRKLSR